MIKGIFVAFGIMLLLALIPLVHFVGIPFGPFIGGYFGISRSHSRGGSYVVKGLLFGTLLGLLVFLVGAAVAVTLSLAVNVNPLLLWLAVAIFTLYTTSMGALGAMYSLLHSRGLGWTTGGAGASALTLDSAADNIR